MAKGHACLTQLTFGLSNGELGELDQLVGASDLAVQVDGQFDNDARGFAARWCGRLWCAGLELLEPLVRVGGSAGCAAGLGREVDQRCVFVHFRDGASVSLERAQCGDIFERNDGNFELDRLTAQCFESRLVDHHISRSRQVGGGDGVGASTADESSGCFAVGRSHLLFQPVEQRLQVDQPLFQARQLYGCSVCPWVGLVAGIHGLFFLRFVVSTWAVAQRVETFLRVAGGTLAVEHDLLVLPAAWTSTGVGADQAMPTQGCRRLGVIQVDQCVICHS